MRCVLACLVLTIVVCATGAHAAGKLSRVRKSVRTPKPKSSSSSSSSSSTSHSSSDDDDDGIFDEVFGVALLYTLGSPFYLPHWAMGDDFHNRGYFLDHPYANGREGYMVIHPPLAEGQDRAPQPPETNNWSMQFAIEDSYDFDGLNRTSFHLQVDSGFRLGGETEWTYLYEDLGGGDDDEMVMGDINVTFRFAQNEHVQMRAGLGMRVMADDIGTEAGFNFTYGIDIFPADPLVISGSIDLGTLGEASVFHGKVKVGAMLDRFEPYIGYDYLRIDDVEIHGPTVGLRLWF